MSEQVDLFRLAVRDKIADLTPTVLPGFVFREAPYSARLEFLEPELLQLDSMRAFQVVARPDFGEGVFFGGYDATGYVEIIVRYDLHLRPADGWLTLTQMVAADAVEIKKAIGTSPNATTWPGLTVCNVRAIRQEGPLKSATWENIYFLRIAVEYRFET